MKKLLFYTLGILIWVQNVVLADETVSSSISGSLKPQGNEPNVFSIIFSLLFVIFLIYITGIVYSKLNLVGAKTVKKQFKDYDMSKAVVISTTQLGQNKNLHVIELNNHRYLIGATQNSINLIKDLGEEIGSEVSEIEEIPQEDADKSNDEKILLASAEQEPVNPDDEIYKKYL